MSSNNPITKSHIESLPYTDFVGLINQWNVLPGAHSTLSKWLSYAHISDASTLLEVACTTGFASRELAQRTGCKATGFDLSEQSISMARHNAETYAPNARLSYQVADGYAFNPEESFSHIVVGAALKFFPDPDKMFARCVDWLQEEGTLLASPFYVTKQIPQDLLTEARAVFGITPTTEGYKEIMQLYQQLEVLYEDRCDIVQETDAELKLYCTATIERAAKRLNITDEDVRDAMYQRLYRVKEMSNKLRPFQQYSALVLRYRKSVYPNRYTELF